MCIRDSDYIKPSKKVVSFIGLGELGVASATKLILNNFNVCGWSRAKKNISKVKSFTGELGLKKSDYKKIDVAIVANPNPTEVKKLVNLKWIQSVWAGVEKLVESFKGE